MFDFFEKKLIEEGYIEDGVYDHVIGYAPPFIYRKKDALLKKFTEFEEKERISVDGRTIYYVTTIYEDRNGLQQPLLLYRIPGKSSTGKVPFTCLWVFAMALNGKCVTISSIRYRHSEEDDSPEWEYDENEEIIFENDFFYSDIAKDSWFEIKNNESKDLLVLVEPITEELVDYDDSDL